MRNAAIEQLTFALPKYLQDSGLLTDELEDPESGAGAGLIGQSVGVSDPLDERISSPGVTVASYSQLQGFRTLAMQALGALAAYDTAKVDTTSVKALRAELYALQGYSEIFLADLFCSGVPLSTLDFGKDFTYGASLTTQQVYQAALAQFDTALTLARGKSDSVVALALLGKGRTYLDLGGNKNFAAAADDVTSVPSSFRYVVTMKASQFNRSDNGNVFVNNITLFDAATVSNQEGINGLPFLNGDPRSVVDTLVQASPALQLFIPITTPAKYVPNATGFISFTLASGTEARLIEAEAALQAELKQPNAAAWLADLNQLRTSGGVVGSVPDTLLDTLGYTGCTGTTSCDPTGIPVGVSYAAYTLVSSATVTVSDTTTCQQHVPNRTFSCANPTVSIYADPTHTHTVTVWQPGTGSVAGLAPLIDPGSDSGRVRLMFRERAYWLFVTGHRQGDLRRLLREYGTMPAFQSQGKVYPTGHYFAPGTGLYGTDVNVPVPSSEDPNPNFHGCLSRNP